MSLAPLQEGHGPVFRSSLKPDNWRWLGVREWGLGCKASTRSHRSEMQSEGRDDDGNGLGAFERCRNKKPQSAIPQPCDVHFPSGTSVVRAARRHRVLHNVNDVCVWQSIYV